MADAVTTRNLVDNGKEVIVRLTNISDGTGESNVVKVDKSALATAKGAEPVALDIAWIRWAIQGFSSIRISFDHGTDVLAAVLSGNGYDDFAGSHGLHDGASAPLLTDSGTPGDGSGDLLLTTAGAAANSTYDITIALRKRTA
jgi:hypothetical protein